MLFKAIFTNSFGILISRILGFVRDLLTASVLGANIYSDIFFVAFKLPNLFRRIFAEGAFTQAFIPSYAQSHHKSLFASVTLIRFFGIVFVLSIVVSLFAPWITKIIAFGFSDELIGMAAPLVAINFFYLDFIFIVTFLAAMLQYKNHFSTTAFSTALLNITMISALLISQDMQKNEIVYYLSYGVLAGGFLQLLVHIIAIKKLSIDKRFIIGFRKLKTDKKDEVKEDTSKFNKSFIPAIFGSSTAHISAFLDTWLASFLIAGSISYLYYANRLFQLPLALFAIATSIALFPMISKAIASKEHEKALATLKKSFWFLLYILSFATAIGIVLNKEIVWLLFERGEFTQNDTINTSWVLIMYLVGLVPFGLAKLFSLWLYSHNEQLKAAKISAISLGGNIILSLALIIPLESAGLALASSLSGVILFILTIKAFGKDMFFDIIADKKRALIFILVAIASVILAYIIKGLFGVYI